MTPPISWFVDSFNIFLFFLFLTFFTSYNFYVVAVTFNCGNLDIWFIHLKWLLRARELSNVARMRVQTKRQNVFCFIFLSNLEDVRWMAKDEKHVQQYDVGNNVFYPPNQGLQVLPVCF